ncbi:MAG: YdcF family protein [Bacteroidota bacterium]
MQKKHFFYLKLLPFLALTLIIISSYPYLLKSYADFFSINNYSRGADAILILGGSADSRAKKSVELLNNDYAKKILITEPAAPIREYQEIWVSEFDNLRRILKYEKIPYEVVPNFNGGARSTFDEAKDLLKYLETTPLKKVIIVTDSFHTRRAKYAFDKVFIDSNCKTIIEIAGAKNDIYDETNWWKSERGLNAYVSEFFKYIIYITTNNGIEGVSAE